MMKRCTKCGQSKPLDEFYRKSRAKDGREYRCKACINQIMKEYYQDNSERIKANQRARIDPEYNRAKALEAYYRDRQRGIERVKKWQVEHPERRAEIARNYIKNHPEKCAVARALRRSSGDLDPHLWETIIALFEHGTCIYCGTTGHRLTMDHWMPVSKGGKTIAGNLIPCCKPCNSAKHAMLPNEWVKKRNLAIADIELFLRVTAEFAMEESV